MAATFGPDLDLVIVGNFVFGIKPTISLIPWLLLYTCGAKDERSPWVPRDDLECHKPCEENKHVFECCRCSETPKWQWSTEQLYIERISILGTNLVIPYQVFNNESVYSITYKNKQLKYFPSNICNYNFENENIALDLVNLSPFWNHIVKVDFSYNCIEDIINMNCLSRIDTLNLSFNKIGHLSNTSFQNLTFLREIFLQNNKIKTMDSAIFSAPMLSLQKVDISYNQLSQLDVTNMFSVRPFCNFAFNSNPIKELSNPSGYNLDTSITLGPGMVQIRDNDITEFPNFKELLHLDTLAELGSLIRFGVDLLGIPLICDCYLEPFMSLTRESIATLWTDYFNITCDGPEHLKGESVAYFIESETHNELICDLSHTKECSRHNCTCIDQPSSNTLFVNCSGQNMTEMPDPLPSSVFTSNINLDLSNNNIKELINTSYLQNVSHLSLADNDLMVIHDEAALMLENATVIDMSNNENLWVIPPVIQYRPNGSIILNNLTIRCDCSSRWIQNSKLLTENNFTCRVPNYGDIAPEFFSRDLLDCDDNSSLWIVLSIILGFIIALLIILGGVSYWLRYEILIFLIRLKQAAHNKIAPVLAYDAFLLSYDDDDDDLRSWINTILVPYLEKAGYKIFVPLRDLMFGNPREFNTLEVMNKTRSLLIVLSESYKSKEQKSWLQHEWKYGWNMFKLDRNKNIVMINFDQIVSSEISQSQIKAFLRVGGPVDFSNTKRDILEQISQKLGPPISKVKQETKTMMDKKKFTDWQMFMVKEAVLQYKDSIDWRKLENKPDLPYIGKNNENEAYDYPNIQATPEIVQTKQSTLKAVSEANPDLIVTEKERPAFGRYKYYV